MPALRRENECVSMALTTRLWEAGLMTDAQRDAALSLGPKNGGALVTALSGLGVQSDALAGFFASEGYGPPVPCEALARAYAALEGPRQHADARQLFAVPIARMGDGWSVAMVDPSDRHARRELAFRLGAPVVPRVARAADFAAITNREAMTASGPEATSRPENPGAAPEGPSRPTPVAVRSVAVSPTPVTESALVARGRAPLRAALLPPAAGDRRIPPDGKSASLSAGSTPVVSLGSTPVVSLEAAESPPVVLLGDPLDRWSAIDFLIENRDLRELGGARAERRARPRRRVSAPLFGRAAGVRRARDLHEAVVRACDSARLEGRLALFLVREKESFRGYHKAGGAMSLDAVRNLWIPLASESAWIRPILAGLCFFGGYGGTLADQVLRAALESRDGRLAAVPVHLGSRPVGVLAVDGPSSPAVLDRLTPVALALGHAIERIRQERRSL